MPRPNRPIVQLLDLLGRKWTLRIIWELRDEPMAYRRLQLACDDISPTILAKRLKEIEAAGIIAKCEAGYTLTRLGRDIGQHVLALSQLAQRLE